MAIGVYRLYLSIGWTQPERLSRLVGLLDALPAFFYRIDRVMPEDLASADGDTAAIKSAVRIAMTQSHIAIVDPAEVEAGNAMTAVEVSLARTGFRRRVPVLAVADGALAGVVPPPGIDRIAGLVAEDLTIAIQDLAEEAAAERRLASERWLGEQLTKAPAASSALPAVGLARDARLAPLQTAPSASSHRPLPFAEIAAAFDALKATRGSEKPRT